MEGGSANDYDYCDGDPVNCSDIDGRYAYHYTFDVGPAGGPGSAEDLMYRIQQSPQLVFPFVITGGSIVEGQRLCTRPLLVKCDPVRVIEVTPTSFTFQTLGGHVEGAGSIITFSVAEQNGRLLYRVDGRGPDGVLGRIPGFNRGRRAAAYSLWSEMAGNVRVVWGALGN